MKYLWLVSFLVACSSPKAGPALDPTDPCNEVGAPTLGAEVAIKKFEPPPGCVPDIISEYEPNGKFGQKLFTKRSAEKMAEFYLCPETPLSTEGIDFTKDGVTVILWEHPESTRRKVIGIRDDGKLITVIQELSRCSTGDPRTFVVDQDALVLPIKDRTVAYHNCPVNIDVCK
jgi:hypothetical protein